MVAIGAHCARLETLYVFNEGSIDHDLQPLDEAIILRCEVTDIGVQALLKGCPRLEYVDVEHAADISNKVRVELVARCGFTSLELEYWEGHVDNSLVQALLKVCPALKTFEALPWLSDATLAACAQHCPLLERLDLTGSTDVTAAAMVAFLRPTNVLCHLIVADCPQLDDEVGFAIARSCPLLEYLRCVRVGLSDASMVEIAKSCHRLRTVEAIRTPCGDASCIALAEHCSDLRKLSLTAISAAAVAALVAHAAALKVLILAATAREDALLPLAERGVPVYVGGRKVSTPPEPAPSMGAMLGAELVAFLLE